MKSNKRILFWALGLGLVSAILAWGILSSKDGTKSEGKSVAVVVAKQDIPPRTSIDAGMVEVKQIPSSARHPNAYATTEAVEGKVTKQTIYAGEQVLTAKLFAQRAEEGLAFVVPAGKRAVSIEVSETIGSGGLIVPGDHVDIIGIIRTSQQQGASQNREMVKGVMVLQNVEVLAMGQSMMGEEAITNTTIATTDGSGQKVVAGRPQPEPKAKSVTLAVTPDQARHLLLYGELGELRLALRSPKDADIVNVPTQELYWDVARSTP